MQISHTYLYIYTFIRMYIYIYMHCISIHTHIYINKFIHVCHCICLQTSPELVLPSLTRAPVAKVPGQCARGRTEIACVQCPAGAIGEVTI